MDNVDVGGSCGLLMKISEIDKVKYFESHLWFSSDGLKWKCCDGGKYSHSLTRLKALLLENPEPFDNALLTLGSGALCYYLYKYTTLVLFSWLAELAFCLISFWYLCTLKCFMLEFWSALTIFTTRRRASTCLYFLSLKMTSCLCWEIGRAHLVPY